MEEELVHIVLNATITILALGMMLVSLLSYRQSKNMKLLFVSFAFSLFFIKGITLSIGYFSSDLVPLQSDLMLKIIDVLILILLFMPTLKR